MYNTDKEYSIVGKVEIGTDEYRDLIKSSIENEREASNERSNRWKAEERAKKAEEQLSNLKQRYEEQLSNLKQRYEAIEEFFVSNPAMRSRYTQFLIARSFNTATPNAEVQNND